MKPQDSDLTNLDIPIQFLETDRQKAAAPARVAHHLVQAMNALLEAANYSKGEMRQRYFLGVNVLQAVFQGVRTDDPSVRQQFDAMRGSAEALLAEVGVGNVHHAASPFPVGQKQVSHAKELFVAHVMNVVTTHVNPEEQERKNRDNKPVVAGFPYKKLTKVAHSESFVGDRERAEQVAWSIIVSLFWEFPSLHRLPTRSDEMLGRTDELARIIGYLMYKGGATAERIAQAALLVMGVEERALKNFFSGKCLEEATKLSQRQ